MNRPSHPAASLRNVAPILGALRHELAERSELLEIGSGSACHAISVAAEMPGLTWQTSDLEENHEDINKAIESSGLDNVLAPLKLDMRDAVTDGTYDAVFSCNTAHIMSAGAVDRMIPFVAGSLRTGGRFVYYGPFRRAGKFSTQSNAQFDTSLRSGPGNMGIRDLDELDVGAIDCDLHRERIYAMPANNLLVVWEKR